MTARLAVVDDDEAFGTYLQTLFRTRGYEVDVYSSGGAFLEGLRAGPQPNVVLLDVMMPGVDGIEVCRQIDHEHVKVIMLSARDDHDTRNRAEAAGADLYLSKPFSAIELLEALERLPL